MASHFDELRNLGNTPGEPKDPWELTMGDAFKGFMDHLYRLVDVGKVSYESLRPEEQIDYALRREGGSVAIRAFNQVDTESEMPLAA